MTIRRRVVAVLEKLGRQRLYWGGLILVYSVLTLTVVIPMGRRTLSDHREVKELQQELADLDAWTVAGMWLAPEVARRQPVVAAEWERAFPDRRQREGLFLDIAKVADGSGLQDFTLREIGQGSETPPPRLQGTLEAHMGDGGAVQGVPVVVPRIELTTYRLKAGFKSDFKGVTRFLDGLQDLDRALSIHDLVLRQDKGQVKVDLEMDVYVSRIS